MKCASCRRLMKDGQQVVHILKMVGNGRRGDFAGGYVSGDAIYVHLQCLVRYAGGQPL